MVYGVICQMINISIVWGDTARIVEYAAALAFHIVILVRYVTLFSQRHKIKEMCCTIDRLNDSKTLVDEKMMKIVNQTQRFSGRITKFCLMVVVVALVVDQPIMVVHALMERKIPMRLWYPYDVTRSPLFEMTAIFTAVTVFVEALVITVSDTVFMTLMIQTIGQFQLLNYKLENSRKLAEEKIERDNLRKKHVSNVAHALKRNLKAAKTEEVLDIPVCAERELGSDLVIEEWSDDSVDGDSVKQDELVTSIDLVRATNLETKLEMERHLKGCLKHHQKLLRLVKDLGIAFKTMLWQQIIFTAMGGFVMLYVTTLASSVDATVILFSISMFGFYAEYFLFCWLGHKITDQGLKVRDAVYDCDWFGASESFKRCMRVMIARTNKPLVIKGGGLPLSVGTCRLICRASYYFHTLLSKMFHGEKILKNRNV